MLIVNVETVFQGGPYVSAEVDNLPLLSNNFPRYSDIGYMRYNAYNMCVSSNMNPRANTLRAVYLIKILYSPLF